MDEYAIQIAGLPARAGVNTEGYFATVVFESVFINGSPLVVTLNPPVATLDEVSLPATVGLANAILQGAVIQP